MTQKIRSAIIHGIEAKAIEVEVDLLSGMPAFTIVGLGDTAIQESKERIRSAIKNSGAKYPQQKKIINLAPANFRKSGPSLDLPMALGLLAQSDQITIPSGAIFVGELALDGTVKAIDGALAIAILAKSTGTQKLYLPLENAAEAAMIDGVEIYGVTSLNQFLNVLKGTIKLQQFTKKSQNFVLNQNPEVDFSNIHGQKHAKRALEIAAAGHHNLLLYGPPGIGKTMLAKAINGILPTLDSKAHTEVIQIYSSSGHLQPEHLLPSFRPFREVHHTISKVALIGGGANLKPGEITLAHHGVLFLDEIAEFPNGHIEGLRQPIEAKNIILARSSGSIKYPANFMLVAAMNPCKCGFHGDTEKRCICTNIEIINYSKKISGPILDRIDITVEMPRQNFDKFNIETEKSESVRNRINAALKFKKSSRNQIKSNSLLEFDEIKLYCGLSKAAETFLADANNKLALSLRRYNQVLKVARTIADLAHQQQIQTEHLGEALQYRSKNLI